MQEKSLHKLGKTDLLTIIYRQEKQIEQLTEEVKELKQQLDDRTIKMKEAGSIAEASLKINKIFEVAQQAADEYLRSIKEVNKPSHECAVINEELAKDEANAEIKNNFRSQNTYENHTNDKTCKELVLVNNKLRVKKPKLLRRVVIFLVFLWTSILSFGKKLTPKYGVSLKRAKLSIKTKNIKIKYTAVVIIKQLKLACIKIKKHITSFCKHCYMQFLIATIVIKRKLAKLKEKQKVNLIKLKEKLKIKLIKLKAKLKKLVKYLKVKLKKLCKKSKKVAIACIKKLKSSFIAIERYSKKICIKTTHLIITFSKKIMQDSKKFIKYCSLKFVALKFRIRNIKTYKKKLLSEAKDVEEAEELKETEALEKTQVAENTEKVKIENALVVVNSKLILCKKNIIKSILNIFSQKINKLAKKFKQLLQKFGKYCIDKIKNIKLKLLSKMHNAKIKLSKKMHNLKTKLAEKLRNAKAKLAKQIHNINLKLANKKKHVKLLNEVNLHTKIEEANNKLVPIKVSIIKVKENPLIKILSKLKIMQKAIKIFILRASKKIKPTIKRAVSKLILIVIKVASKLVQALKLIVQKTKTMLKTIIKFIKKKIAQIKEYIKQKRNIRQIKKETQKALIKNIQIIIPDLEKEIKKRKEKSLKISFIKTLGFSTMVIIAFAIITSTSLFKILQVSGTSMEPNLHEGELLITSKFFKYGKGDMVAFYYNDSVLIKRVIATEGDTVYIEYDGTVYVNNEKLQEDYVKELSYGNCDLTFPYQVPKDSVFILGDNRATSVDSRSNSIGCISTDKIIGKIQFRLNPFVIY